MRIVYLCKRHYMGHDVIADRYARLYEQPRYLAERGHEVLGLSLSYRATEPRDEHHATAAGQLHWVGLDPGPLLMGLLAYPSKALALLRAFKPDLLIAASDAPHIVIGAWLARRMAIPFAADLYDHFESFGLSRLPGLVRRYRQALHDADVVSCVSQPLADLVRTGYGAKGRVLTLPSTIDRARFYPRDRLASRRLLKLPEGARLVGTAGGLSREKGVQVLYDAYSRLALEDDDLHLVLAGSLDPQCPPPPGTRVHYLGMLPHDRIADLFSALDVGVVYVQDTPYGRYSFPQKAFEIQACGTPLAVARVGAMANVYAEVSQVLYEPGDAASLAACMRAQLANPVRVAHAIPDWAESAAELEAALLDCQAPWGHGRAVS